MSAGRRAATAEVREIVECPAGRIGPCLGEHALARLSVRDVEMALDSLSDLEVGVVARCAGVRLPVSALRSGGVNVLVPRVQRARGALAHRVGILCSKGPFVSLAGADIPEDDFNEAVTVLAGLRERCSRRWSAPLVELAFALTAEGCPALAPALEEALAVPLVEPAGPPSPVPASRCDEPTPARRGSGPPGRRGSAAPEPPGRPPTRGGGGRRWNGRPERPDLADRAGALGLLVAPDFDALDEVVLASVCAGPGDPDRGARALAAARDLRGSRGGRVGPWYVEGFAQALLAPRSASGVEVVEVDLTAHGEAVGPPAAAAYASWVGSVFGHVERGDREALSALCRGERAHIERLVGGVESHALAAPVLAAALPVDPGVAGLLRRLETPVEGWPDLVSAVLAHCSGPIGGAGLDALLGGLDAMCTAWATDAYAAGEGAQVDAEGLDAVAASVALARAIRRRARNDFAGARHLLERISPDVLTAKDRGFLALECALAEAGIGAVEHVEFPSTAAKRAALGARLRPVVGYLRTARALMPDEPQVLLVHALAAHCVDGGEAQSEFEAFRVAVGATPAWRGVAGAVDYHLGLAALRALEPGTDAAAVAMMAGACEAGFEPSGEQLRDAVEALEAHGSDALPCFLASCLEQAVAIPEATAILAAHAASGAPAAIEVAGRIAVQPGLPRVLRFSMVEASIRGLDARAAHEGLESLLDAASDVLARNQDADLDERWECLLHSSSGLRELLDPAHADLERLHVLRRLGRAEEAAAVGRGLFFRAAAGELPDLSPAGLLAELDELDGIDDAVAAARQRLDSQAAEGVPSRAVRVVFVGGDERQARLRAPVEAALAERFGGHVEVVWFFPGWSAGWADAAERAEAAYDCADVLVLMPLVRTQLGRRLRRSAGEAGLPWVACTGHGRGAILHAIEHAADVVERLRTPTVRPG
jgi:hypothetical protein